MKPSTLIKPLHSCTQRDQSFTWNFKAYILFSKLKEGLIFLTSENMGVSMGDFLIEKDRIKRGIAKHINK